MDLLTFKGVFTSSTFTFPMLLCFQFTPSQISLLCSPFTIVLILLERQRHLRSHCESSMKQLNNSCKQATNLASCPSGRVASRLFITRHTFAFKICKIGSQCLCAGASSNFLLRKLPLPRNFIKLCLREMQIILSVQCSL